MLAVVLADGSPPSRGPGRIVNVWRDDDEIPFAEAAVHGEGYRLEWRGIGTLTFAPGTGTVTLWPAPGLTAGQATDAVLQFVQPVVLQALGHQTLHASAVRLTAGAVAFCGVSGSGKSTLAFALGQQPGIRQVADDGLVLTMDARGPAVHTLPFQPRLRPESRQFLATLASGSHPQFELDAAPLLAVFILEPRDGRSPIEAAPIGATQAFTALLTHAHCFDESNQDAVVRMVEAYLTLADVVPVYRLRYAKDFDRLSAVQTCVLETIGAAHSHA